MIEIHIKRKNGLVKVISIKGAKSHGLIEGYEDVGKPAFRLSVGEKSYLYNASGTFKKRGYSMDVPNTILIEGETYKEKAYGDRILYLKEAAKRLKALNSSDLNETLPEDYMEFKTIREFEWSMGSGQCHLCCGCKPGLTFVSNKSGHRLECPLADVMAKAGYAVDYDRSDVEITRV